MFDIVGLQIEVANNDWKNVYGAKSKKVKSVEFHDFTSKKYFIRVGIPIEIEAFGRGALRYAYENNI